MRQRQDGNRGSGLTPAQQLAMKKANKNRSDAAGRSGMGEDSQSNIAYKVNAPNGGRFYKAALLTGRKASQDAGGRAWNSTDAGINSVTAAHGYAYKRKQEMNPRTDNSGYGNSGFGASRKR